MILEQIKLQNFGLYSGDQTVNLLPPSREKPIILFGGLNGGGKTTLLDAIQLGLFGGHARISNRGTRGYQNYLSQCIHKGGENEGAAIEIKFRHTVEGVEEEYELKRTWWKNGVGCKERLDVTKGGFIESALAKNWNTQVEEFFPYNISHLFLFDGEKVEAYASEQESAALIGATIQNLLGLDVVDQLEKDLQVYEQRKRSEVKGEKLQIEISAFQKELKKLRGKLESERSRQDNLSKELEETEKQLNDVSLKYVKLGGELYDRQEEIEEKLNYSLQELKEGEEKLREISSGALPLHLVCELLLDVQETDVGEVQHIRAQQLESVLKKRDHKFIEFIESLDVKGIQLAKIKKYLSNDRKVNRSQKKLKLELNLIPETRKLLSKLVDTTFSDTCEVARIQVEHQKIIEKKVKQLQLEKDNIPSNDIVLNLINSRDSLLAQYNEGRLDIEQVNLSIEKLERELEIKEQQLTKLIENEIKVKKSYEDRTRILSYSSKVRSTISNFRLAIVNKNVHRIERLVFESYKQLLRKETLVSNLKINTESFELSLFGRDGKILALNRLSAGERQLLAIALLWGLAKATGRTLPTAIDTPLGRLDSVHRMHLIERYLPYASHQLLLLSTDEEITGPYFDKLIPYIGRTYHLKYDESKDSTQITEGYLN